jgi:uncharacterized protein (TIGR02118 family)
MMGGMIIISVLYPKTGDSRFDHDYYMQKHMPLVKATWGSMGLVGAELMRGTAALDGGVPAYELIGNLTFGSLEQMQSALAVAAEILADIPNFTNVQPVVQICEPVSLS